MDDSSGTCPYTPPEWWVINGHNMIGKLWHQLCTQRSKCQWLVVHAVATAREVKNVKSPCPYSANWGALKSPKTNELTLEAAGQTKRPAQFALRGCSLQGAVRLSYDYSLFKAQTDLMGSISPSQGITLADSSEPCWNLGVCWNLRPDTKEHFPQAPALWIFTFRSALHQSCHWNRWSTGLCLCTRATTL